MGEEYLNISVLR